MWWWRRVEKISWAHRVEGGSITHSQEGKVYLICNKEKWHK
jgi:hypothetical protein